MTARSRLVPVLLLVLAASPAFAQGQLHLAWNDCPAQGGTDNMLFACNLNSGAHLAVGSFVPPLALPQVNGVDVIVEILGADYPYSCHFPPCYNPLPAWWQVQPGGCRPGGLFASFEFSGPPFGAATQCHDFWQGEAVGMIAAYQWPLGGDPSRARVRLVAVVPTGSERALAAGEEYYLFQLGVLHSRTVGAGSCEGCCQPATLFLGQILVTQPPGVGDFVFGGDFDRQFTVWQRNNLSCATPAVARSWGQLKSLYR